MRGAGTRPRGAQNNGVHEPLAHDRVGSQLGFRARPPIPRGTPERTQTRVGHASPGALWARVSWKRPAPARRHSSALHAHPGRRVLAVSPARRTRSPRSGRPALPRSPRQNRTCGKRPTRSAQSKTSLHRWPPSSLSLPGPRKGCGFLFVKSISRRGPGARARGSPLVKRIRASEEACTARSDRKCHSLILKNSSV